MLKWLSECFISRNSNLKIAFNVVSFIVFVSFFINLIFLQIVQVSVLDIVLKLRGFKKGYWCSNLKKIETDTQALQPETWGVIRIWEGGVKKQQQITPLRFGGGALISCCLFMTWSCHGHDWIPFIPILDLVFLEMHSQCQLKLLPNRFR